jgi:predicted TIM-barrel fold metal-dependent hydrolase
MAAKQSIIDFRLRPPVEETRIQFPPDQVVRNLDMFLHSKPAPSFLQRSTDLLFQEMDEVGVKLGVMSGSTWEGANLTDEDVANVQNRFPGRIIGLANADLEKPMNEALQGIENSIRKLKLKAVCVEGYHALPPMYVDDERLSPIYEKCIELGVFVQLGSGSISSCPDMSFTDPVHYERVALKYPDLKIVIAHACYPYVAQAVTLIARRYRMGKPDIYLEPDMFLFMPGGSAYLEAMNIYPDNFLFASTYPYGALGESVERILKLPIDEKTRAKFFYDNAAKLLGV